MDILGAFGYFTSQNLINWVKSYFFSFLDWSKDTTKIRINLVKFRKHNEMVLNYLKLTLKTWSFIISNLILGQYLCHIKCKGIFLYAVTIKQIVIMCFSGLEALNFTSEFGNNRALSNILGINTLCF